LLFVFAVEDDDVVIVNARRESESPSAKDFTMFGEETEMYGRMTKKCLSWALGDSLFARDEKAVKVVDRVGDNM
jgi:hypothetical protein